MNAAPLPRLALDVDDVCIPTTALIYAAVNAHYGLALDWTVQLPGGLRGTVADLTGQTEQQVTSFIGRAMTSAAFARAEPVDGAREAVAELSRHYDLVAVTARGNDQFDTTCQWMHHTFDNRIRKVHCVGADVAAWRPRGQAPASKTPTLIALGAVALVDDTYHHIADLAAARAGITGVWFGDYVWQHETLGTESVRCHTWAEVTAYLLP